MMHCAIAGMLLGERRRERMKIIAEVTLDGRVPILDATYAEDCLKSLAAAETASPYEATRSGSWMMSIIVRSDGPHLPTRERVEAVSKCCKVARTLNVVNPLSKAFNPPS